MACEKYIGSIEQIVNGRNGNPAPWTDVEVAVIERSELAAKLEASPLDVFDRGVAMGRNYTTGKFVDNMNA